MKDSIPPTKNESLPNSEPEKEKHVIPPGTEQETGLSRFIRKPDDAPELIKDARLNNLEDTEQTSSTNENPTQNP